MIVLHIVLRHFPVVFDSFFSEKIHSICLLQKCITHILFIFQNQSNGTIMPSFVSTCSKNPITLQSSCNLLTACAFKIFTINSFNYLCLFWIDNQMPVLVLIVAEETSCIDHYFALLKTILHSQLNILTQRFRFLLCQ